MYLANWEAVFLFLDLVTMFLCRSNVRASPAKPRDNACDLLPPTSRFRQAHAPVSRLVYQTPGIRRFVRAEYAAYSSPNLSPIILSSARMRSAKRTANASMFDGPATQFGMTSAWPTE